MEKSPERYIKQLISDRVNRYFLSLPNEESCCKVLDVGCGKQPFRSLIEGVGLEYYGLDLKQNSLGNVDYLAAIDYPFSADIPQGTFDLILCTEVMEHVANWSQAFSNFNLLLKNGGSVVFTAPFFYFLHEEPFDYWRPTPHAFRYFAEQNSLKIVIEERLGDGWDIMGTFLEVSYIESNLIHNIRSKILFKLTRYFFERVRKFIRNNQLQQSSSLLSPFFHSNFLVLSKSVS